MRSLRLVDGGSHAFALTAADAGDVWNLSANLLLYMDHGAAATSGALTKDTIAPTAMMSEKDTTGTDGSVTANVGATRNWTTSGYVITSAGKETTTVTQTMAYDNVDVVSQGGFAQNLTESDKGQNVSVTTDSHNNKRVDTHQWSYPISVQYSYQEPDASSFSIDATVNMTRQLLDSQSTTCAPGDRAAELGPTLAGSQSNDQVWSTATFAVTDGALTGASGRAWQNYAGTDDVPGQWYEHYLAATNGYVTADRLHVLGR